MQKQRKVQCLNTLYFDIMIELTQMSLTDGHIITLRIIIIILHTYNQ